jgi:site-specific recombinase XerC
MVIFDAVDESVAHLQARGNLRAVQILLGHSNFENTVRYLGVDVDDALTLPERPDI